MKKLWGLPTISIYLYGVTILTQYGFYSYFGIPSKYIESSIKENIIFFFQMFRLAKDVAGFMKWWVWIMLVVAITVIFLLYNSEAWYRKILNVLGIMALLFLLYGTYNFGVLLGKTNTVFYVLGPECVSVEKPESYVIPDLTQDKLILIPIDENRKILGGFLIKDTSDIPCKIEMKYVGPISK